MKSLHKVLDILDVFLDSGRDNMRLSEISELTKLDKQMVNRAVKVLVNRGYLNQPKERGCYYLGTKLVNFQKIITRKRTLVRIALPHMNKLSDKVRECVIIGVQDREWVVINEVVESKLLLRASPDVGAKMPLYCSGLGKVILAHMPEQEVNNYFKKVGLERRTENTITDIEDLKNHLLYIVREGFSYDDEEQFLGIRDVAAPVINADDRVFAAVGVVAPSLNLSRSRIREIAPYVKLCALDISRELGYEGIALDHSPDKILNVGRERKTANDTEINSVIP